MFSLKRKIYYFEIKYNRIVVYLYSLGLVFNIIIILF